MEIFAIMLPVFVSIFGTIVLIRSAQKNESTQNYMIEGMVIGMLLGLGIQIIGVPAGVGLGMLFGMIVGINIRKKKYK